MPKSLIIVLLDETIEKVGTRFRIKLREEERHEELEGSDFDKKGRTG